MNLGPHGLAHPDWIAALQTMPKDELGHVVDLHYVPPGTRRDKLEAAWRAWVQTQPADRKTWPRWLVAWADEKKRGKL
jgi:hypothetical protein